MKDHLAHLVRSALDPTQAQNIAREYLQARILGELQRVGAMGPLAFHGGTALRFLYGISRYSEDLDFALERPSPQYDLRRYIDAIRSTLHAEGYAIDLRISDQRTVHSAFVRFGGLLNELALSPHRDAVLAVKIEVDTSPPAGAGLTTSIVRRHVLLNLQHHDRASLLAGKLHALLQRPYAKGRDVYDLLWYLSDPSWPAPNLALLNSALAQTGWEGGQMSEQNWRNAVRKRLERLDWPGISRDVRPFLDRGADLDLLTLTNLSRLLA